MTDGSIPPSMAAREDTARRRYGSRADDVRAKLHRIGELLDAHAERQRGDPCDWGFVGDLDQVYWSLAEIETFLSSECH